jgi:hypothetical protein
MAHIPSCHRHGDEPASEQRLFAVGTSLLGYAGAIAVMLLMVAFVMTAPSLNGRTSEMPRYVAPN